MRKRGAALGVLAAVAVSATLATGPLPAYAASSPTSAPARHLTVGSVTLTRCDDVLVGAYCGHVTRRWDPTGHVAGVLPVGFAFLPAKDTSTPAVGTLLPHEGGPGYSTTGTGIDYAQMYGPLLRHRNLLLVDQRGTGLSRPIYCHSLQALVGPYAPAAATCAAKLGDHFDLYGSALSADDLSAVISALGVGPVDMYGDSYGTFFSQVFLGRHPDQLRSLVLDSAYPTYGEDAWYATQTEAMQSSFATVCQRTPSCAALGGSTIGRLTQLLDVVRRTPLPGRATGADGRMHQFTIGAADLTYAAFAATYAMPTYREFDPAIRAALAGDTGPLARIVAENNFVGATGSAVDYSEGLDAAVTCQDYPQIYDMAQPPAVRQQQYDAAIADKKRTDPDVYGPFTLDEYNASGWSELDWCLQWPVADPGYPTGPPQPEGGHYAAVPTMVLSGELDSITTPAEGALVAGQIRGARQVIVANSFHVTATDDTDGCGRALVQAFVAQPRAALPASALQCAANVPPVRGAPTYSMSFRDNGSGAARQRAAMTAAQTVADIMDRYLQTYASTGTGLRGGTWRSAGDHTVTLRLNGVRLASDLAVSGTVVWGRYAHTSSVTLQLSQVDAQGHAIARSAVNGSLSGTWDTRAAGARVSLTGSQGGQAVSYGFLAP